jgi:hypothetical protein
VKIIFGRIEMAFYLWDAILRDYKSVWTLEEAKIYVELLCDDKLERDVDYHKREEIEKLMVNYERVRNLDK